MRKKTILCLLALILVLSSLFSVTACAAEEGDGFFTVPVSTIPESDPADLSWFAGTCVIGHSQAVGMSNSLGLPGIDYYAISGLRASYVLDCPDFVFPNGRIGTLRKAMETWSYERIYILLGINDCTTYENGPLRFRSAMEGLLDLLRETQPQAKICLFSLLPVGLFSPDPLRYNRENVILYSQILKTLSREYETEYLDLFRPLADENGYLQTRFDKGDGIHLFSGRYAEIREFLLRHTW